MKLVISTLHTAQARHWGMHLWEWQKTLVDHQPADSGKQAMWENIKVEASFPVKPPEKNEILGSKEKHLSTQIDHLC